MTVVPFADVVQRQIERAFEPLVTSAHLALDFTGSRDEPKYSINFEEQYEWSARERRGCRRTALWFGVTGTIYVAAIRDYRFCTDVTNCKTCEPVFRRSPDELGKMLA